MLLPFVALVTDAHKVNLNLTLAAVGWGPESFSRKVCAIDPGATFETAPTHWLTSHAGASTTDVAMLQAMTNGDLPQPANGAVWGVDGVISAADAMAASDNTVFQVYSAADDVKPVDHVNTVLTNRGLQYVPEPPL